MSLIYEDLLTVPFKLNGRDKNGMDCYGLCIELCKRQGVHLNDIVYETQKINENYNQNANVKTVKEPIEGGLLECLYGDELHVGYLLDKKTVLHMTYEGFRVSPLKALKNPKFYEVVND